MTNRLKDKFVLITGATAGIGRASAELFAKSGCQMALTGRREQRLDSIEEELKDEYGVEVETGAFDIRNREACESFVASLSRPVDILINNAGLASGMDAIYEGGWEDWDAMIDTNVKGLLAMTRLISPSMKDRNSGHIINVSSIAGYEAYSGGAVYCATKHAVKAITEAAKKDLHGTQVRVSMVSPGLVETEFSVVRFKGDKDRADEVYDGADPLTATDIAEVIHFIANRPPHVNILDSIVYTVHQSSATTVYRENE